MFIVLSSARRRIFIIENQQAIVAFNGSGGFFYFRGSLTRSLNCEVQLLIEGTEEEKAQQRLQKTEEKKYEYERTDPGKTCGYG